MTAVTFPELFCPFPSALNPHFAAVHEQTLEWASHFRLIDSPAVHRRFCQSQFSLVVGRAYPNATLADLRLICDWNTALFVWDDQCDEAQLGWQPEQLQHRCEQLLAVLLGGASSDPNDQVIRAFANVAHRLHQRMPQRWVRRFVHTVQEYVEGTLWEAHNRAHARTPDLATYLRMRPLAGALHPYFEFADLTENVSLPIEVRNYPIVERLGAMAANVVVWSNDIFSLDKELRHHDTHNLVVVLQQERQLSLQAAVDQAAELHNTEVRTFVELETRLPSFGPTLDAALQRYVGVLRSWMRANLDWSFETGRYRPEQPLVPVSIGATFTPTLVG